MPLTSKDCRTHHPRAERKPPGPSSAGGFEGGGNQETVVCPLFTYNLYYLALGEPAGT